jgi:hypothetical protein
MKPRHRKVRSCLRTTGRFARHHRRLIALLKCEPGSHYSKPDGRVLPWAADEVQP